MYRQSTLRHPSCAPLPSARYSSSWLPSSEGMSELNVLCTWIPQSPERAPLGSGVRPRLRGVAGILSLMPPGPGTCSSGHQKVPQEYAAAWVFTSISRCIPALSLGGCDKWSQCFKFQQYPMMWTLLMHRRMSQVGRSQRKGGDWKVLWGWFRISALAGPTGIWVPNYLPHLSCNRTVKTHPFWMDYSLMLFKHITN